MEKKWQGIYGLEGIKFPIPTVSADSANKDLPIDLKDPQMKYVSVEKLQPKDLTAAFFNSEPLKKFCKDKIKDYITKVCPRFNNQNVKEEFLND